MPAKQRLRIEVSRDDSPKEEARRMSSPMDLYGIDISALDARDVPGPSPIPSSFALPMFDTRGTSEGQRDPAQLTFGSLAASQSISKTPSGHGDTGAPSEVSSRSSSRAERAPALSKPHAKGAREAPAYLNKATGLTPELSWSQLQSISSNNSDNETRTEAEQPNNSDNSCNHAAVSPASVQNHHQECQPVTSRKNTPKHHSTSHRQSIPTSPHTTADEFRHLVAPLQEKRKSKFSTKRLGVLSRTRSKSNSGADAQMASAPATPTRAIPKTPTHVGFSSQGNPVEKERSLSLRDTIKSSNARARSEDRGIPEGQEVDFHNKSKAKKDKKVDEKSSRDAPSKPAPKSNGTGFFASSKTSGKPGRGFFSKLTRSSSSTEKVGVGVEEDFEPQLLKLPLVEQTRETRIARSYDNCRDKTEFWMPALPWRCIDYLNGKCEEEGLYRVSGGLSMVRRWRRRFDTERDVNLLDEPDLYDASVIASLFKEWIRELPEEIFPKSRQVKVAATLPTEPPGQKPVPQSFRDELSNLPPFNYYLLFAITCHLSLLLSHEPKNKMTLDNLYRCFNQSLKLDGRVFYTLVGNWRQCWQGCYTENEYLRAEYEYLNTPFPEYPELERRPPPPVDSATEDRALASSSEDDASATGRSTPDNHRPPTSNTQPSNETGDTEPEQAPPQDESPSTVKA